MFVRSKTLKALLSVILLTSMFSITSLAKPEPAAACYPAYTCMKVPPKDYSLVYQNSDRRKGLIIGGVVLGGVGFLGTTAGVGSLQLLHILVGKSYIMVVFHLETTLRKVTLKLINLSQKQYTMKRSTTKVRLRLSTSITTK